MKLPFTPLLQKAHDFVEEKKHMFNIAICELCSNRIVGTKFTCFDCNYTVHPKCKENMVTPTCGGLGTLRLKITHNVSSQLSQCTIVLPLHNYIPFVDLIKKENYALVAMVGKVCPEREELAKLTVSIA